MKKLKKGIMTFILSVSMLNAHGSVKPASVFGDHMVLQQGMSVPIWGEANPGESVTVRFAGQIKKTKADKHGKWIVKLDKLKASSNGSEMVIKSSNSVKFTDILVGEVWVCAGQSNMELGVYAVPELKKLVPEAEKLDIRTFRVAQRISLKPVNDLIGKWKPQPPKSAVSFGFSYYLQKNLGVPVGIIQTSWGSSSLEGWMPIEMTKELPHFKKIMDDFYSDKDKLQAINKIIAQFKKTRKIKKYSDDPSEEKKLTEKYNAANICARTSPNLLYNAMFHPIIPYSVRGMVWYQGEANTRNPQMMKQYAESLQLWVKKLRSLWGKEDLAFLEVMLPGFGRVRGQNKDVNYPDSINWSIMRESQEKILELPHTSVANTIDLGDLKKIHPTDKKPLCERLALLAEHDVYGKKVVSKGPTFKKVKIHGKKVIIEFANAKVLRTKDGKPARGFWLAGKDKKWYEAKAKISGKTVTLTSSDVPNPVACRYAYAAKPDVNLVNEANLPAYPFRTDNW